MPSGLALLILILLTVSGSRQFGGGRFRDDDDRKGVPEWSNDPQFKDDVFTFVRLRYTSGGNDDYYGYGYGRGWRRQAWRTDFPDSDLNFSFRLQQLTSLKVNPDPIILDLTDERIFDYPFLYMIEPGSINLTHEEVEGLRRYLLGGGFVMVDDFWTEWEWDVFYRQIKEVFPNREPIDVPLDHPIFHCVYDLKERPQVPSIHAYLGGMEYERDGRDVHYRAIYDDEGRMMMFICHNTDLGDGWEREGIDEGYFHEYSEKRSYPMGINIVTYAMTH
jgi:hypothetical protein